MKGFIFFFYRSGFVRSFGEEVGKSKERGRRKLIGEREYVWGWGGTLVCSLTTQEVSVFLLCRWDKWNSDQKNFDFGYLF